MQDKEDEYYEDNANRDPSEIMPGGSKATQPKTLKETIVRILNYFADRPNLAVAASFFALILVIIFVVRLF